MAATGRLEAVVLDLDDTLIVEAATARASLRATAALVPSVDPARFEATLLAEARRHWRAGPHHLVCTELGFSSWEGLWATFEGGHPRLEELRRWAPAYRRDTWRSALGALGIIGQSLATHCAERFVALQERGHPLVPGAAATLATLAERFRLGLLTNGPPDLQRRKLAAAGLDGRFEAVIISGEVGVGKPDPAAFELALRTLGTTASSTLMVGDSWDRDIVGARSAGWSAVWVSGRRRPPGSPGEVPVVGELGELTALLG